jgi:methionyl-tRNA synthetase
VGEQLGELEQHLSALKIRAATAAIRQLWVLGNEYITQQQPWKLIKAEKRATSDVLKNCFWLMQVMAAASWPVLPSLSTDLWKILGLPDDPGTSAPSSDPPDWLATRFLPSDARLFVAKIQRDEIDALKATYAGRG